MSLKQISSFLAGPGGFLVLVAFFLPWVTISCSVNEDNMGTGDPATDAMMSAMYFEEEYIANIPGSKFASEGITATDNLEGAGLMMDESMLGMGGTMEGSIEPESSEGYFLMDANPLLYLLPVVGLAAIVMAALGYFEPRLLNMATGALVYIIPAVAAGLILIFFYMNLTSTLDDFNAATQQTAAEDAAAEGQEMELSGDLFTMRLEIGWYLQFVGLFLIFGGGLLAFLAVDEPASAYAGHAMPTGAGMHVPSPTGAGGAGAGGYQFAFLQDESKAPPVNTAPPEPKITDPEAIKQGMNQARDLIKAKDYSAARRILRRIEHPRAKEWLLKVDELDPFGD